MSSVAVTNTFSNGAIISASEFNTNFTDLVTYINNRNSGSSTWDVVSVSGASIVPLTVSNSSGTQNIANFQDNGTNVLSIADGGATTITATAGGSSIALLVNNSTSTGNVVSLQDNGTNVLTVADGGVTTVTANAGTNVALTANNGTSTGNIFQCQDNGSNVLVVADGGIVTIANQSGASVYRTNTFAVSMNVDTKIQWENETYDTKSEFDIATNHRFTATKAGKYLAILTVKASHLENDSVAATITKNGSALTGHSITSTVPENDYPLYSHEIIDLAANDYLEANYLDATRAVNVSPNGTTFSVQKIA